MEAAPSKRTDRNGDPNRTQASESWSYEHTRILPEAFEALDTDRTLNILDAGPAEPQTISFFRRFSCRLYVANLFNPSFPTRGLDSAREFFDTVDQVRFDVCFLWDYINYPDNDAFADFVSVLANHVHEQTRVYAIGAYSAQLPLRAYRYAIADTGKLAILDRPAASCPNLAHAMTSSRPCAATWSIGPPFGATTGSNCCFERSVRAGAERRRPVGWPG